MPAALARPLRFAVAAANHPHIYLQTDALLEAGAELASFWAPEPELAAEFQAKYPAANRTTDLLAVLEDPAISLVTSAAIFAERAALGIAAMEHGKDVLMDKPGFTTLAQLEQVRAVQARTGRFYCIYFNERLNDPATLTAAALVHAGAIGRPVQTIGLGPHRLRPATRPAWFFDPVRYGGILNDLASHQADQFLLFTGAKDAKIAHARAANTAHPQFPGFQDFGEALFQAESVSGFARVDWLSPEGLDTWGDERLFILGADGYIEVRRNCDLEGRSGGSHLFLVDSSGSRYLECATGPSPFARAFLGDVLDRTQTAFSLDHDFAASRLALEAQIAAERLAGRC